MFNLTSGEKEYTGVLLNDVDEEEILFGHY